MLTIALTATPIRRAAVKALRRSISAITLRDLGHAKQGGRV